MKRMIAFLLALVMLLLVACSKGGEEFYEENSDINNESESESEVGSMETEITADIEVEADKNLNFSLMKSTDIDALLARPYIEGVPTAFSEGLFSTYSSGWGFKNGTVLATGNKSGFGLPIDISINDKSISPQEAIWMPSHVKSMYDSSKSFDNIASEAAVSASYTSQYDKDGLKHLTDGVVSYNDDTRNRWSNYANPIRTQNETITFDFAKTVTCASLKVHLYDDEGNTLVPKDMKVEYYDGTNWVVAKNQTHGTIARCIGVDINFDAVQTTAVRLIVIPQSGKAVGITEVKVLGRSESAQAIPGGVTVEEKKFITENDVVASVLSFTNKTSETVSFKISASPNKGKAEENFGYRYIVFGGDVSSSSDKEFTLDAGKSVTYKLAVAVSDKQGEGASKINSFVQAKNAVEDHAKQFKLWFEKNIPYFDCDDKQILQIYYFRWLLYRNNIRKITDKWNGYIISEFLPNVPWAGLYNSISCPAGHHFYEGRWIRDEKYLNAYQEFWFIEGANPRLYSFPIADAYYNRYLVTGDKQELTKYLDKLCDNYKGWEKSHYVSSMGLFKQIADRDGMENAIGGDGIRATINSYMYGDAVAIANIAILLGKDTVAKEYMDKAENLRKNMMEKLWNEDEAFFETIKEDGTSVNVRELLGYVPWYFNLPEDDEKYSVAFAQLLDSQGFRAPYGPTTAERRDPKFMSVIRPNCRWDGPSWPFATSQTLVAAANLLNNYRKNNSFKKGNWYDLLKTYAKSQYKNGYPWVAENIHPITGEWIVDYDRSIHYNHSSYVDIVITGLVGIRPEDSDKYITINPLLDSGDLKYFMLENVSYRGHNITVIYDSDGNKYGIGAGLFVYIDGELSASTKTLSSMRIALK